jgi:hypothetical protein
MEKSAVSHGGGRHESQGVLRSIPLALVSQGPRMPESPHKARRPRSSWRRLLGVRPLSRRTGDPAGPDPLLGGRSECQIECHNAARGGCSRLLADSGRRSFPLFRSISLLWDRPAFDGKEKVYGSIP